MFRRLAAALSALALHAGSAALAQTEYTAPVQLTGTLAKARAASAVAIAFRESSIPFSYLSARKEPIGYSIELCKKLVEEFGEAVGREMAIQWLAVTSETRFDAIASGRADLECGSTTDNLERRELVAFSPTIFVAGTKLLVRRGSPIKSFRDLGGRTVVVTAGTTNEKAMQEITRRFKIEFRLVTARDHAESYAQLEAGKADAFATDDVLLHGLVAQHKAQKKYQVVGEFLSYDPYGVMFRKDDAQLAALVKQAFHDLAEDGEVERQYKRWFLQRLPSGESLDLPMSPQLETLIRAMAVKPE
jgi:glutamate/aspartate transport system substrate-binding protein